MRWNSIGPVFVILLALGGCAKFSQSKSGAAATKDKDDTFIVMADQTAFYRHAPKRNPKPDEQLTKDTLVTVIRHGFGYSKIRLASGEQGFVANDALHHAADTLSTESDAETEADGSLAATPEVTLPVADPSSEEQPSSTPPLLP